MWTADVQLRSMSVRAWPGWMSCFHFIQPGACSSVYALHIKGLSAQQMLSTLGNSCWVLARLSQALVCHANPGPLQTKLLLPAPLWAPLPVHASRFCISCGPLECSRVLVDLVALQCISTRHQPGRLKTNDERFHISSCSAQQHLLNMGPSPKACFSKTDPHALATS